MPEKNYDLHYLRSGLTITPTQYAAMEQSLAELVHGIPARFALLTDVTGQVVAAVGDQSNINLVGLASLVAGDLAASQEIARLTGEYQDYQLVLREGPTVHSFILDAGQHLALFVQVSNETPLGWARMFVRKSAQQLAGISLEESPDVKAVDLAIEGDDLSDLLGDALDDIWLE